jgi:4,5-dihydroxyphthalate decarboxylase
MAALRASFVPSPLTQAIIQGSVRPDGVELDVEPNAGLTTAAIIERNSKRMVALELDVAEMSFGTFTRARDRGLPIVGLPVFPGRRFLQPGMIVGPGADIAGPTDLRGKRAVLGQFWQTASIWHRIILHEGYGIGQDEMSWVCLAPERWDALPQPSAPVRFDSSGRDALALLEAGEVDVALLPRGRDLPEGGETRADVSALRPLFDDVVAEQCRFFERTGLFPIIHLITMREELARDEETVGALCEALAASKRRGLAEMIEDRRETPVTGGDPADVPALLGADPWPYGVTPNRRVLESYLQDVYEHQHLTDRLLAVEELFPARLPAPFA